MSAIDLSQVRRLAWRVVLGQAAVTMLVALVGWSLAGRSAGVAALLGGGIATAASGAMSAFSFGQWASASAERMLAAFYAGEIIKLALVIALFVIALRTLQPVPGPMLAAYGATFLVYWIVLARAVLRLGGWRKLNGQQG